MKLILASNNKYLPYVTAILSSFLSLVTTTATAQIIPDATLPNNTIVLPNGNQIEITGGTTAGNNLFHSFREFSVLTNNTALFDNATNIENIIGRITGSSISEIDGLLKANGTANLFLINPNGIVFGENAALDLGGSFIGSTANSIQFADGSEFSAVNPQAPPLLTVNIPVGLQYGNNNGDITVKGKGHNAFFDFETYTVNRLERNRGLAVKSGNSLALIGKNIFLDRGNLTAEVGNIELGTVASGERVELIPHELGWAIGYGRASNQSDLNRGDINLVDEASIDVSGNSSGNLQIQANKVSLTGGSAIFAETEGDATGGAIAITANEVEIIGADPEIWLTSSIWSDVYLDATGDGGSVEIETNRLLLEGGGQINVNTFSLGNGGNLKVKAKDIKAIGESDGGDFISGLFAQADIFLTGRGGNIEIQTDSLLVRDGAQIATTTFGEGDAGNLTIEAQTIELIGDSEFSASGLFAVSDLGASGNSGNLVIKTNSLQVRDGAQIAVTAKDLGDAGTVSIEAENIELNGVSEFGSSGLFASTEGEGNGGNLTIATNSLTINDGGQIASSTFASGDAGTVSIEAENIELNGVSEFGSSGLFVSTEGEGNGGNLTIATNSLTITDGGQIASSTFASGDAGTIEINASNIQLTGTSELGASGIFSGAITGTGNGGNLNIKTSNLSIKDGATISASNFFSANNDEPGQGKAGNISIAANSLQLDNANPAFSRSSSISASTNNGGGGNIEIAVANEIAISNNSEISADTKGDGNGGNIDLVANKIGFYNRGKVSVNSTGLGNAGNIQIVVNRLDANGGKVTATSVESGGGDIKLVTDFIYLDNHSELSTSVLDGTGGGGNLQIQSNYIIGNNNSDITANAVRGDGGNIDIGTNVIFLALDSDITASSQFGLDGAVKIKSTDTEEQIGLVRLPDKIIDPTALITAICPVEKGNALVTTGKGGMSDNPRQSLRGESVWEDLRGMTDDSANPAIIEAKAWSVNSRGNLELLNSLPAQQKRDYWTLFNQCSSH